MDRHASLKMSFVPNLWKFAFQKDKPTSCWTQFRVDCSLLWSKALNMRSYGCKIAGSDGRIANSGGKQIPVPGSTVALAERPPKQLNKE